MTESEPENLKTTDAASRSPRNQTSDPSSTKRPAPLSDVLQKGQDCRRDWSDVGATAAILDLSLSLSLSLISIISTLSDLSLISEEVGGPPAVALGWRQFKIQAENGLMDRGLGCVSECDALKNQLPLDGNSR